MPYDAVVRWPVLCVLASCGFDANYANGHFTCSDGKCPTGQVCVANECVSPHDGGPDADAIDARQAALLCTDPGILPAGGGTANGSTGAPRTNTVSSLCNGLVMNGPDAVYRVDAPVGNHIGVTVAGSYPVRGYVIAPCVTVPATPACIGNVFATATAPISVVAPTAGQYFIILDGENAGLSGSYTLTVSVTP